jgi:uncharacterized protein YecT (DUF1311 family)
MKTLRVILATFAIASALQAIEWPKDYEPVEDTSSPDGRYGILAVKPPDDSSDKNYDANKFFEELEINYLADLKKHQIIAPITGVSYPDMAHRGPLTTQWAADDSWCVACYDGKWGFRTVKLLQLGDGRMKQTDLGDSIQNECDKVTKAFLSFSCKPEGGSVLEVSAAGLDNPKELPEVPSHYVVFSGTYDLAANRWRVLHAHAASRTEYEKATGSEAPHNDAEEARRAKLDTELNRVYHELKARLPAESFAKVQIEQRDWLAGAGMEATATAENDRTQARIEALGKLLRVDADGETPEARRDRLDAELNAVYRELKAHCPADQFAKIVVQQRDWLAGAGKAATLTAENVRTEERVRELQKLLKAVKR